MDNEEKSLKKLQLILIIEEFYSIKITDSELQSIETIDDLTDLISKKLGY